MVEKEENLIQGEKIYVMSDYLKSKKRSGVHPYFIDTFKNKKKKSFPLWLIWIFFGFIIIAFAAIFYFNPNLVISLLGGGINNNINNQKIVNDQSLENLPQNLFEEKTLKNELKEGDNIIVAAELFLPKNSLDVGEKITLDGRFIIDEKDNNYQVIGGLFEIFSLGIPKQEFTFKIFYNEELIDPIRENDLKIGYWQENLWIVLPTEVNVVKNTLITKTSSFYSGIFAAIISNEKISEQPSGQEIIQGVFGSQDSDNDGLTDVEEEIYQTDKNNRDTDNDSMADGDEIINLYSPISGYGVKLADTNLIKIYNNNNFKYSLFYPSSFLPKIIKGSNESEIIISSELNEFFSIVVQDNLQELPVKEWYQQQIIEFNGRELKETIIDSYPAVWSLDGLTIYVGKNNLIYALTHNIGGATVSDLRTTFLMLLKSFKFID